MSEKHSGRVIVNFRRHSLVEADDGTRINCIVKGRKLKPVAGDYVQWEPTEDGGAVTDIGKRHGVIERYDTARDRQVLAANVDLMVVVQAIEPALEWFTMDKYLAAAEANGIEAVIVINKIDLANDNEHTQLMERLKDYADLAYPIQLVSTETGAGMSELRKLLAGNTNILVGPSGVGKSSIASQLLPEEDIRIGEISEARGEGKHTTTVTTLYHLREGGELIDSPGVREYRLWPMPPRELAPLFREFRRYTGQCRFADCLHRKEPSCAIKAAVESGEISERRYHSYASLLAIMEDQYRSY